MLQDPPPLAPRRSRLRLLRIGSIADGPISSKSHPNHHRSQGTSEKGQQMPTTQRRMASSKSGAYPGSRTTERRFNSASQQRYRRQRPLPPHPPRRLRRHPKIRSPSVFSSESFSGGRRRHATPSRSHCVILTVSNKRSGNFVTA